MSLITFVIPSLNRDTLSTSVESLLNQTNENWRCVIVYDGIEGMDFSVKCDLSLERYVCLV